MILKINKSNLNDQRVIITKQQLASLGPSDWNAKSRFKSTLCHKATRVLWGNQYPNLLRCNVVRTHREGVPCDNAIGINHYQGFSSALCIVFSVLDFGLAKECVKDI